MTIDALIDRIVASGVGELRPPVGMPVVPAEFHLPADLRRFYERCGGVDLFPEKDYGLTIVEPDNFRESNVVILGEQFIDDISRSWFIVGRTTDGEYVSIDLSDQRLGWCYDSFHEAHGVVGSSKVIAKSFTQLLSRLLDSSGGSWYWLEPDFVYEGDAYD